MTKSAPTDCLYRDKECTATQLDPLRGQHSDCTADFCTNKSLSFPPSGSLQHDRRLFGRNPVTSAWAIVPSV